MVRWGRFEKFFLKSYRWRVCMVRWMVDNDPVVGTFVILARIVSNCRPVKGIPLSGRPHSFQDLIVDDGVLRQPFHDLGRVQRRFPFHLHRRIPEIVAQFVTGDTLQKYNESWTKSLFNEAAKNGVKMRSTVIKTRCSMGISSRNYYTNCYASRQYCKSIFWSDGRYSIYVSSRKFKVCRLSCRFQWPDGKMKKREKLKVM